MSENEVGIFSPSDPAPVVQVSMTDSALEYVRKQLAASPNAKGIMLGVKKSGCSGFKYDLQLAKELAGNESVIQVSSDIVMYVTAQALPYVNGTEIDYAKQGLNSSMVFNNPNAKDECGCGESFNV